MNNIRKDFPGSNGQDFSWCSSDHLRFSPQLQPGEWALWFHFLLENPSAEVLTCEMVHGDLSLGWPFSEAVKPVFRHPGGEWQRVPTAEVHADEGRFLFQVPCARQTVEIAFCHPYQVEDWKDFCGRIFLPAGATARPVSRTEHGRVFEVYEWGRGDTGVLLFARCHAGETPGSFTLEGVVESLLPYPDLLRLQVVPFVDLDGVIEGDYGKDKRPVDFYFAWGSQVLMRPTVQDLQQYIEALSTAPKFALDLHAPAPNDPNYLETSTSVSAEEGTGDKLHKLVRKMIHETEQHPETELDKTCTAPHPDWFLPGFDHTPAGYLQSRYSTLALTVESSYHQTHQGVLMGPEGWRLLGKALGRALVGYLEGARD